MKLTFEGILNNYLNNLENLKLRKEKNLISEEYFNGSIQENFFWFQNMKDYCEHEETYGTKRKLKDISSEEKEKYKLKDGDYPLIYIISYRGEEIPVYSDDYGQQDFAVFNGETISGGAYNFFPEMEFCYIVDKYLENKYLEELFPEEIIKKPMFFGELMKEDLNENK